AASAASSVLHEPLATPGMQFAAGALDGVTVTVWTVVLVFVVLCAEPIAYATPAATSTIAATAATRAQRWRLRGASTTTGSSRSGTRLSVCMMFPLESARSESARSLYPLTSRRLG